MIKASFKPLLTSLILLISLHSISYADFYVIPVAKKGFVDTSSGDATANDILMDKKVWVDGAEVTGNIEIMTGDNASTVQLYPIDGPIKLLVPEGYYDGSGAVVTATESEITGLDADLSASNIKSGVTIFGVYGSITPASGNAADGDVLSGQTYSNSSGSSTGTMPDNEEDNESSAQGYTGGIIKFTAPTGFYDGDDTITATEAQIRALDADITSTNIASGINIFGQAGDSNVVDTSSGDAGVGDIAKNKKAWVNGSEVTGIKYGGYTCTGTLNGTRWCNNLNGTVTDLSNGLVWLKFTGCIGAKKWIDSTTWNDAQTESTRLYDGATGFTYSDCILSDGSVEGNWRLPTKTELIALTTGIEPVSSGTTRAFDWIAPECYWSSTTYKYDVSGIWCVSLVDASVKYEFKSGTPLYVWPVRGGQ